MENTEILFCKTEYSTYSRIRFLIVKYTEWKHLSTQRHMYWTELSISMDWDSIELFCGDRPQQLSVTTEDGKRGLGKGGKGTYILVKNLNILIRHFLASFLILIFVIDRITVFRSNTNLLDWRNCLGYRSSWLMWGWYLCLSLSLYLVLRSLRLKSCSLLRS